MNEPLQFDYFYGIEADQFTFYRIPRSLIKDERFKGISNDAKLLYGLMLDRMGLSMKNNWIDEENRAFIRYTVENIMEDINCGKEKAVKLMAELDSVKGIGLIERKRIGLGKPDIIYVKNFATVQESKPNRVEEKPANTDKYTEVGLSNFQRSENQTSGSRETELQEVGKSDLQKSENQTYAGRENRPQQVGNPNPNNTYTNYTDFNQSEHNQIKSNHISTEQDGYDAMDEAKAYMELIKDNLEYDILISRASHGEKEMLEEIYNIICDVVCVKRRSIKVNGEDYPYEIVKNVFLKLNSSHIEYVAGCLKDTATKVTNIRQYLITALYNAPMTISHYYQQEVQHDMYGGGWHEKSII